MKVKSMIFVNNPLGLDTFGSTAHTENKCLLSPNDSGGVPGPNITLFSSGFPETRLGSSVNPFAI